MSKPNMEEITSKVLAELSGTPYACSELTVLSGGTANFLYKGTLENPLKDGETHIVIKHAEPFVKNNPAFPLSTDRCRFEETALEAVRTGLGPVSVGQFTVKTPRLLHYNPETNTQVHEDIQGTVDLKTYALEFWSPAATNTGSITTSKEQCYTLGHGLGSWLRSFHDWADAPEQHALVQTARENKGMQKLKHMLNYPNSLHTAEKYPDIFGPEAVDILREIATMAEKELEDEDKEGDSSSKFGIIHGDFWTGNALIPNKLFPPEEENVEVVIIDWELIQMGVRALDVGQMLAELYELKLFKEIDAGVWVISGFAEGYGKVDDDFAFRVATHVGSHLINWSGMPGWGDQDQVEAVVGMGRDIVMRAWRKDRNWFAGMELGCLFSETGT